MIAEQKFKVGIVDYGLGNLFSIERALQHIGADCLISDNPEELLECERVVLPGVGAFADAMKGLKGGLADALKKVIDRGIPLLGICLGMQLMMTESEEFGRHRGLGLIRGKAVRLQETLSTKARVKIPHIGWNSLNSKGKGAWARTILEGLEEGTFVYFVHSYIVVPDDRACVLATTEYGKDKFCSVVSSGSIIGCQFHPERSGEVGLNILRNFVFNNFQ